MWHSVFRHVKDLVSVWIDRDVACQAYENLKKKGKTPSNDNINFTSTEAKYTF